jgi:hypothetical protein
MLHREIHRLVNVLAVLAVLGAALFALVRT